MNLELLTPDATALGGASRQPTSQPTSAGSSLDVLTSCVRRARSGDTTALALLWKQHHSALVRFFQRRVRCADEADDLASETLCAAFSQLDTFRGAVRATEDAATFQSFLYGIAHNKLRHWIRQRQTHPCQSLQAPITPTTDEHAVALEDQLTAPQEANPEQNALEQARLDAICFALGQAGLRSPEQFKALMLHYVCDLPHKEVATLLDTRRETVNTRLQEGREKLREHYTRVA